VSAPNRTIPPQGTVERWAFNLITSVDLDGQLKPPACPRVFEDDPPSRTLEKPGRAPELEPIAKAPKSPRAGALVRDAERVKLIHTFLHHEIQAAELFAWALLKWPRTPRSFRRGLAALAQEELLHARLYAEHLTRLGAKVGDHGVRDWFWERVPSCSSPAEFCALQGLGFEGGNLEHMARYAAAFRHAGDNVGAQLLLRIAKDEERHVRFARRWFERWTGPLVFDRWREHLPAPLTPTVLRGRPLARAARRRAGLDESFLDELEQWIDAPSGS
jgi:uncharacterized ferritin-like protein (DUF455 family)